MPQNEPVIPPLTGEKVETPDGPAYVIETHTFEDEVDFKGRDFRARLASRLGSDYARKYYRVVVELEDSKETKSYNCWEIDHDANRDVEKAPWRRS